MNIFENVQTRPNAFGCIRMHPNGSEWIRMGPNASESTEQLAKTSKSLAKTAKNFAKTFTNTFFTAQYVCQGRRSIATANSVADSQVQSV